MTVESAIRARVSVKDFTAAEVPRGRIEDLIELAALAPNHRMTEPVRFRVLGPEAKRVYAEALARRKTRKVDDPEAERAVREKVVRRTLEVPSMIGVVVHVNEDPEIREEDYATAFMAVQNLSLAVVAEGLGTHIKTGAVMGEAALRESLEVGDDERLVAIVFLGEPEALPDPKPR
ncbi:MAG TPA: nitroreductase, partial [Gemmatimonadota bacterium]|nr:nitroreductase [Gemmatimonadota bacterium]